MDPWLYFEGNEKIKTYILGSDSFFHKGSPPTSKNSTFKWGAKKEKKIEKKKKKKIK